MNPRRSNSSLPKPGRSAYGMVTAVGLLLIPVAVLVGGGQFRAFMNFGAGVLSLVSLSCSVIWGLVAQDRIFLNTRQRIVGQAVHRTTAVASIAFLLLHITTKVALGHTQLIAAVIPFSLGVTGSAGLIGLGSLAGLLMIFVGVTGALRGNFASPAPVAARWRAMHMLAYPAWCAALVHGLYAGRQAKPVFVILYALSLLGVMGALALRGAPRPVKRRIANRFLGTLPSERPGRDELDASRSRGAESVPTLPGYERQAAYTDTVPQQRAAAPSAPFYDAPAPPAPTPGFAAAYRAVSPSPQPQRPFPGDQGAETYGGRDVRDTGETNPLYRTYNPNDTYNSGPTTEPSPGASFDPSGAGEPWNTPSGGYR